tara:strand:- start:3462 stop:4397 length:936 start_codon:yes stop_codon:yes gene_type:complete
MELNILKELQCYFKNFNHYFKVILLITLLVFFKSIFETPKYTTSFSFYQKDSTDSSILQQFGLGTSSENLSLEALVKSKDFYRYLANVEIENGIRFVEFHGFGNSLKSKILDKIFYRKKDLSQLNFDRATNFLTEDVISFSYNNSNSNIIVEIIYDNIYVSEILANAVIEYVNDYYSIINNQRAFDKNQFISIRLKEIEDDLNLARYNLVNFQENNKSLNSPKLLQELKNLESELLLKSSIYSQLFSQYELYKLDIIDESNTVLLISKPYTPFKPTSPNLTFNLLITIFLSIFFTFCHSVMKRHGILFSKH